MPITQPLPIQNLIAEIVALRELAPGAPAPYPANHVGVARRLDDLTAELRRRAVDHGGCPAARRALKILDFPATAGQPDGDRRPEHPGKEQK
jgi:hypothetical protein